MEIKVLHTILSTELGHFFACLIVAEEVSLKIHKIEVSNGVEVIMPPQELDEIENQNLINKLLPVLQQDSP